jgi:DNA-binding protein YbaB
MFDQLKQMMEMRNLQAQIKKQSVTVERQGVSLSLRGDFEVTSLVLSNDLDAKTQARVVLELLREAREKIQKDMAQLLSGKLTS